MLKAVQKCGEYDKIIEGMEDKVINEIFLVLCYYLGGVMKKPTLQYKSTFRV